MGDKYCENGHLIDESWDICPYCAAAEAPAAVVQPRTSGGGAPEGQPAVRHKSEDRLPVLADFSSIEAPLGAEPARVPSRTIAVRRSDVKAAVNRFVVGWLVGLTSVGRGESWPIRSGRNVIGRDKRCEIAVNDEQVSAHHADLVYRPEERRFILMDHNSTNGTYVNDSEIEPRRNLANGDIIRVGSHKFLFVPLCTDDMYWEGEGPLR